MIRMAPPPPLIRSIVSGAGRERSTLSHSRLPRYRAWLSQPCRRLTTLVLPAGGRDGRVVGETDESSTALDTRVQIATRTRRPSSAGAGFVSAEAASSLAGGLAICMCVETNKGARVVDDTQPNKQHVRNAHVAISAISFLIRSPTLSPGINKYAIVSSSSLGRLGDAKSADSRVLASPLLATLSTLQY